MVRVISTATVALALSGTAHAVTDEEIQLAMGCRRQCDQYRQESSSAPTCSKWNKTLPRPKIGRSCTSAFDEMFKNTCLEMCFGKEVVYDVHGRCEDKRREMPKPVVGNACNEGYEGGYKAAAAMFTDEFREKLEQKKADEAAAKRAEEEAIALEKKKANEIEEARLAEERAQEPAGEAEVKDADDATAAAGEQDEEGGLRGGAAEEPVAEEKADLGKVLATLPVTVDESDINLVIYEKQKPLDSVTAFCAKYMSSAGAACMDQLLPHVERKLADAKM